MDIWNAWTSPWIVGGDFNVICFVNEKLPVGVMNNSMKDFNEFVQIHS